MGNYVERIREASQIYDMDDFVGAVQSATIDALVSVDPSVVIERTGYFNHSAIPDFMLSWAGTGLARPLFIRNSYEELLAGEGGMDEAADDSSWFGNDVTVAISGDGRSESASTSFSKEVLDEREGLSGSRLLTDAWALEEVGTSLPRTDSPVHALVAQNFLRRARGVVDVGDASALAESNFESFLAASEQIFPKEFFEDVSQIRELMIASKSIDHTSLLDLDHLSMEQVVAILPWLLREGDTRSDEEFWSFIARRISLGDLEAARDSLLGLDLSPLMEVASQIWTAARGYSGILPPVIDSTVDVIGDGSWRFEGKNVAVRSGNSLIRIAANGRALKARNSSSSKTWPKVKDLLGDARLEQVQLDGVDRSVLLDARRSPDVKADASEIAGSLGDDFLVRNVVIGYGLRDEERLVEVLFGEGLAVNQGKASIADLVAALSTMLV